MSDRPPGFLGIGEALPFEHLFISFVLDAREDLRRRVTATVYELLTPQAHTGWERYLLSRLVAASAKAAHWQFQVFKTVRTAFQEEGNPTQEGADSLYREFVGDDTAGRLEKLFSEFPALATMCDVLVKNWLSAVADFLGRFDADQHELSAHLGIGRCIGPVLSLQAGLSDPHRGGRCVVRLHLQDQVVLIYKPRSLAPEAHFRVLLEQLNSTDIPHRFRSACCWDRGEYGWMENVAKLPCSDLLDVHAFYWRAGALLGLVYLAGGVDIHRENMVACGAFPVLVDLETLWHSPHSPIAAPVQRTGMLPQGDLKRGLSDPWSALSQTTMNEVSVPTWIRVNHDDMARVMKKRSHVEQLHLPVFHEKPRPALDFADDIEAGYRWVGERLLERIEDQKYLQSWLCDLMACPRRFILRSSVRYRPALSWFTSPNYLSRGVACEDLSAITGHGGEALSPAEINALVQLDLPYFEQVGSEGSASSGPEAFLPSQASYLAQATAISESLAALT